MAKDDKNIEELKQNILQSIKVNQSSRDKDEKRFSDEKKQRDSIVEATVSVSKSVKDLGTQMAGNDLLNEERRREQNALFGKLLAKDKDKGNDGKQQEARKGLLSGLGKGLLIASALTGILAATGNLETAVQGWVQGGINFAKNVTKKLVEKLTAFKDGAKGLGKSFRKAFGGVTRSFRKGMNSAVGGITKKLTGALGKLKGGIDDVVSGLSTKVSSIAKNLTGKLAKSGIGTAAKKAGGFFSKVASGVKGVAAKAVGGVKSAGSKVAAKAKGVLGAPVTKFIKGSAGKIIKNLRRVPILGTAIEGIFANNDIKALLANPELSASEKQKAVGSRVLEAIGGPVGAAAGVALLNIATGGAGFLGSFIAAAGGDFAGRFIAGQLSKVLPVGMIGKAMINTVYGGLPEGVEGGDTPVSGITKSAAGVTAGAALMAPDMGDEPDGLNDQQKAHLASLKKALSKAESRRDKRMVLRDFAKIEQSEGQGALRIGDTKLLKKEKGKAYTAALKEDRQTLRQRMEDDGTFPPSSSIGAQMEGGMSSIAAAKSLPAPVIVSGGGGGGQGTTVTSSNITYNGNQHADESSILTRPSFAYDF